MVYEKIIIQIGNSKKLIWIESNINSLPTCKFWNIDLMSVSEICLVGRLL